MDMNFVQVLVDGSLRNTFVLITVFTAGLAASVGALALEAIAYRAAPKYRRLHAGALVGVVAVVMTAAFGRSFTQVTANLLANVRSDRQVIICFMPTNHPLRDSLPAGVVAFATSCAAIVVARHKADPAPM